MTARDLRIHGRLQAVYDARRVLYWRLGDLSRPPSNLTDRHGPEPVIQECLDDGGPSPSLRDRGQGGGRLHKKLECVAGSLPLGSASGQDVGSLVAPTFNREAPLLEAGRSSASAEEQDRLVRKPDMGNALSFVLEMLIRNNCCRSSLASLPAWLLMDRISCPTPARGGMEGVGIF